MDLLLVVVVAFLAGFASAALTAMAIGKAADRAERLAREPWGVEMIGTRPSKELQR